VRPRPPRPRSSYRLTLAEREEISRGVATGKTLTAIAVSIDRPVSTVSRELARNSTETGYRAVRAERMARAREKRPRPPKLASHEALRKVVIDGLSQRWSPQQISKRLVCDFPADPAMRVSHETIYTSLYVQAKRGLPGQLSVHLRTRRLSRRPQRRLGVGPPRIKNMTPISARPAEVTVRQAIGHWEGDLIVGRNGKSHVGTMVERVTRYVVLLHLPGGPGTDSVIDTLSAAVRQLPAPLRRSLTWDRGIEMTRHAKFTAHTGVPVYFADARSPWQRGLNENTNGLLRQYLPRKNDLSLFDATDLRAIADQLNKRPRRALAWQTPHEVMTAQFALVP
jgi:IS30 family transposase